MLLPAIVSWLLVYFDELPQSLQNDNWFGRWICWVEEAITELFGNIAALAVILLLPIAALIVVLELFGGWFFGLAGLVVTIIALVYACGRENYNSLNSAYKSRRSSAHKAYENTLQEHLPHCRQVIYVAYQSWFVTVIWFLLLGIAGAVFYRLCYILAQRQTASIAAPEHVLSEENAETCATLVSWLDWLPLRLWVLLIAASSNFSSVFANIKQAFFGIGEHQVLLDKALAVWFEHDESHSSTSVEDTQETSATDAGAQKVADNLEALTNSCMVFALGLVITLMIVF